MAVEHYQEVKGRRRYNRVHISVTFDDDMLKRLNNYAKRENCTVSEAIRTFVEWGLEEERR